MPEFYFLWDQRYWSRHDRRGCRTDIPDGARMLEQHDYFNLQKVIPENKKVLLFEEDVSVRDLITRILENQGVEVHAYPLFTDFKKIPGIEENTIIIANLWDYAAGAELMHDIVEKLNH